MCGKFQALEIIQGWLTTLHITTFCNHPRKCVYVRLQHINALLQWMSVWRAMKVEILLCFRFECVWLGCYNKFSRAVKVSEKTLGCFQLGVDGSQNGKVCHGKCHGHACSRWFPWTPRTSSWCSFRLLKLANLRADMRWHALLSAHFWTCRSSRLEGWCFTLFHRAYEVLELTCKWHCYDSMTFHHWLPNFESQIHLAHGTSTWGDDVYTVYCSHLFSPRLCWSKQHSQHLHKHDAIASVLLAHHLS